MAGVVKTQAVGTRRTGQATKKVREVMGRTGAVKVNRRMLAVAREMNTVDIS